MFFVPGFTKNAVLLQGEKKWSKDSHTLRETLDYDDNSCAEIVEEVTLTFYLLYL